MLKDKCERCEEYEPTDDKDLACFCKHYNCPIANSIGENCDYFDAKPIRIYLDEEKDKEIIDGWFKEAKKVTPDTFMDFFNHLADDYVHDYGTIVHAMSAVSVAAAWAFNKTSQGGITGFQAGFVMWDFIRHWNRSGNKTGMKLVDYDLMLYPQNEKTFDKIIDPSIWENIQKEAKIKINGYANNAHDDVINHWRSIADGNVPFGYKI